MFGAASSGSIGAEGWSAQGFEATVTAEENLSTVKQPVVQLQPPASFLLEQQGALLANAGQMVLSSDVRVWHSNCYMVCIHYFGGSCKTGSAGLNHFRFASLKERHVPTIRPLSRCASFHRIHYTARAVWIVPLNQCDGEGLTLRRRAAVLAGAKVGIPFIAVHTVLLQ